MIRIKILSLLLKNRLITYCFEITENISDIVSMSSLLCHFNDFEKK